MAQNIGILAFLACFQYSSPTMSQDFLIRLKCAECGEVNYFTRKNRKKVQRKIELAKFCKTERKRTPHKEAKK